MKTIKDMPPHSRPRDKLREKGPPALTDEELVAAILGMGTSGIDVRTISKQVAGLIREHNDNPNLDHLLAVPGAGAAQVVADGLTGEPAGGCGEVIKDGTAGGHADDGSESGDSCRDGKCSAGPRRCKRRKWGRCEILGKRNQVRIGIGIGIGTRYRFPRNSSRVV